MGRKKTYTVPMTTSVSNATIERIDSIMQSEGYRFRNQVIENLVLEKYNQIIERNHGRMIINEKKEKHVKE